MKRHNEYPHWSDEDGCWTATALDGHTVQGRTEGACYDALIAANDTVLVGWYGKRAVTEEPQPELGLPMDIEEGE